MKKYPLRIHVASKMMYVPINEFSNNVFVVGLSSRERKYEEIREETGDLHRTIDAIDFVLWGNHFDVHEMCSNLTR